MRSRRYGSGGSDGAQGPSSGIWLKVLTIVFGVAAVILIVACAVTTFSTVSFVQGSVQTTGTVIEMRSSESCREDSDGFRKCSTVSAPVVNYTTADGEEFTFESDIASNPPAYVVGDEIPVRYRSDDPADARVDTTGSYVLGPLITGGVGIVLGAFAIGMGLAGRSRRADA